MNNELVSIITPAFRVAPVIGETIQSVIAQTHANWEMLIADDCSPDDTRETVRQWTTNDSRIRLIALEQNGGPAAARNAALAEAHGRWIAFLDSDDLWLPTKLEKQIEFHKKSGAKLTMTGFRRISADGRTMGRYIDVPHRLDYRGLLGNTAIATSSVLIDSELAGPVRMKKTYYDDFACWLSLLKGGGYALGLQEDLMRYRVMGKSVSRNKRNSALQVWRAYREIEKLNVATSLWYFGQYAIRGLLKYQNF